MPGEEDWVLRPVMHGLCKYESLIDGTLSLEDIKLLNNAINVKQENELRFREANE